MLDHVLAPQPPQQRDDLVGALATSAEVLPDGFVFLAHPTHADAKVDTAARDSIEGDDGTCDGDRMPERQDVHVGTEPDRRRPRGDGGEQDPRVIGR